MSQAGRGLPNQPPREPMNGNTDPNIPPDLVWDEEDRPIIYRCSQDVIHHPMCPRNNCEEITLDSELQVDLLNMGRAYARVGMSFLGVPASLPMPGISVEIFDVLCWTEAVKEVLMEQFGVEEFEFQERFRKIKLAILSDIYNTNSRVIKERRTREMLGIPNPPSIIGPDGQPL